METTLDIAELLRLNVQPSKSLELRRVIHGRGQRFYGLESLTLDVSGDFALAFIHDVISEDSVEALHEHLKSIFPKGILQDRSARPNIRRWSWGNVSEREVIREDDLAYLLEPFHRQNMGFFPDMRSGRAWVKSKALDKRILNLFAYTCSFSVAAMAGGARSVVNVDMSGSALERGRINHELNDGTSHVEYMKLNILKSWGRIQRKGPYDLIICDPPSQQMGSFFWERDYVKVLRRLKTMVAPHGQVLACLNAPKVTKNEFLEMVKSVGYYSSFSWLDVDEEFKNLNEDHGLKLLIMSMPHNAQHE